jgi:hypothetical protein
MVCFVQFDGRAALRALLFNSKAHFYFLPTSFLLDRINRVFPFSAFPDERLKPLSAFSVADQSAFGRGEFLFNID